MANNPILSFCLCTWNNLEYIRILFSSIFKNTVVPYEICLYGNGSTDGLEEWVKGRNWAKIPSEQIKFRNGTKNLGVAGVNKAVEMAEGEYVFDLNDDMYVLPGCDISLIDYLEKHPENTANPCVIAPRQVHKPHNKLVVFDAGKTYKDFDSLKLEAFYNENLDKLRIPNFYDIIHPVCMTRKLWDEIGGIDEDYYPGWASDWQLAADIQKRGGRMVKIGSSWVYHFYNVTLTKEKPGSETAKECNNAVKLFSQKTGLTQVELEKLLRVGNDEEA